MKAFDQNVTGSKPEVIFEFIGTISNTTLMKQANLKLDLKKNQSNLAMGIHTPGAQIVDYANG